MKKRGPSPSQKITETQRDPRQFKGVLGWRNSTTEAMYPVPPMFRPPWDQEPQEADCNA